jgi:hypothetical protein
VPDSTGFLPDLCNKVIRQQKFKPLIAASKSCLEEMRRQVPSGSPIAQAIRYGFNQWDGLLRFLDAAA